jgi:hypothetical protein
VKLQPVLDRLDGLGFVTRGGALEFAGLSTVPGRLPAAFAVLESEAAEPTRMATGVIDQRVTLVFAVILVVAANARMGAGGAVQVSDAFTDLSAAVLQRIVGWRHPDCSRPTEFVGGRTLSVDGTALTYAQRFKATYHLRKAIP